MKVFLCEKPSQAKDIAAVLGGGRNIQSRQGYLEIGDTAVTWCIGHLFEQLGPEGYDPSLKDWDLKRLPIIPDRWKLKPRPKVGSQINAIRKLLRNASEVVIATDPDREGEVIGREVLNEMNFRGPVNRLLLSALDPASVRKGLSNIRPGRETESLYDSGLGRARADWLVGINLTRAWTIVGRQTGSRGVLSVGRVQTPTLALVVQRDLAIENFVATDYYVVEAACSAASGDVYSHFRATWVPDPDRLEKFCDSEGRCLDFECAVDVASALSGVAGKVTSSEKLPKREPPPLPYSLSQLQQLASSRYGYGAKQTLEIAQALYERHKAITYPRTDSGYLPEDQHAEAGTVLQGLGQTWSSSCEAIVDAMRDADLTLKSPAWNDAKVTAHHGMIPTTQAVSLSAMSDEERNLFMEISFRYLLQFWPDHQYESTRLTIDAAGHCLKATGRQPVVMGWKELTAKKSQSRSGDAEHDDEPGFSSVPFIPVAETVQISQADVLEKKTKPPAHYTEGTLIRAMTNIAQEVEDPDIRKLLRDHDGIGTEATRAGIIHMLQQRGYVETVKKKLRSTEMGRNLIAAVPMDVKDPASTALMERRLNEVETGKIALRDYLEEQARYVAGLVQAAKEGGSAIPRHRTAPQNDPASGVHDKSEALGVCPICGKPLLARRSKHGGFIGCAGYPECRFIKREAGRGSRDTGQKPKPILRDDVQCPECGKPMVERNTAKGPFLGCSSFPGCRGTRKYIRKDQ